ncbi:MAG: glycerol-3-phosphate 1-O-acyltransferase PlsY [Candidatus Omnitrophota bacterium]
MSDLLISLLCAYILGSIPTSFIFARLLKRIDIRDHGSGNVGATNVFRVIGKVPAIIVLVLDMLKGTVSVAVLPLFFFNDPINSMMGMERYKILLGIFAICGHIFSIFLKFKGGKGVATTAGVLIALMPELFAVSALIWICIFAIFRIVSVASIAASIFLPILAIIFHRSVYLILFCVIICIVGTYKHRSNIQRLIRGEENKLF